MPQINTTYLEGYITRDPEVRYLTSGTALATFAISHTRNFQKAGQWEKEVSYIDVKAWAQIAERAAELSKGAHVICSGRLQQERWATSDGSQRSKLVLVCDRLDVVGQPKPKAPASQQGQYADDDLPF